MDQNGWNRTDWMMDDIRIQLVLLIMLRIAIYWDLKRGGRGHQLKRQLAKLCNAMKYLERRLTKTMISGVLDKEKRSRGHQTNLKMPAAK